VLYAVAGITTLIILISLVSGLGQMLGIDARAIPAAKRRKAAAATATPQVNQVKQ
jgi:hypothetical protein